MPILQVAGSFYIGTASEFAAANHVYLANEVASEIDTHVFKVGDGVTAYNSLPVPFSFSVQSITGTNATQVADSCVRALVALGLATDAR